jgi:hypothetical protein
MAGMSQDSESTRITRFPTPAFGGWKSTDEQNDIQFFET